MGSRIGPSVGGIIACVLASVGGVAAAAPPIPYVAPQVASRTTLANVLGQRAATAGANYNNIGLYAGDMGMSTYVRDASGVQQLRVLVGDSWANNNPVLRTQDDALGMICLTPSASCTTAAIATGTALETYLSAQPAGWSNRHGPPIQWATNPFGQLDPIQLWVLGQIVPLNTGAGSTPLAVFSNGLTGASAASFALYQVWIADPLAPSCAAPVPGLPPPPPCPAPFSCVARSASDSTPICVDTKALAFGPVSDKGASQVQNVYVANSDPTTPQIYRGTPWATNKFRNPSTRAVNDFNPSRATGSWSNDYNPPDTTSTGHEKVMVWGRSAFTTPGEAAGLYFAYVDMPTYSDVGTIAWAPHYYTSTNPTTGVPQFSTNQADAAPLTLYSTPYDNLDVVNQVTVTWIEPLKQWMMTYGGDLWPTLSDAYGPVNHGVYGPTMVRFATDPWGPWSNAQYLVVGGTFNSPTNYEYATNGMMFSASCSGANCAPGEPFYQQVNWFTSVVKPPPGDPYGVLYAAEVIEPWTVAKTNPSGADVYMHLSTFNPYGISLVKASIRLGPFERKLSDNTVLSFPQSATGGQWSMPDENNDALPDLVFIKTSGTPNSKVEVHVTRGSLDTHGKFQLKNPFTVSNTGFPNESDGVWMMASWGDTDQDKLSELVFIKTSTANAEVHIASSKSGYVSRLGDFVSGIPVGTGTFSMVDDDSDGKADLVFINTGVPQGSTVQLKIASAASNYATVIRTVSTGCYPGAKVSYFFADYDGDGKQDFICVDNSQSSGVPNVSVMTGASHFVTSKLSSVGTVLPQTTSSIGLWGMGDIDGNKVGDLALIKAYNPAAGNAEVVFASGN